MTLMKYQIFRGLDDMTGGAIAAFVEENDAVIWFDEQVLDMLRSPYEEQAACSLWDTAGAERLSFFDPDTDVVNNQVVSMYVGDIGKKGLIYRILSPGEKELIEDALKIAATAKETEFVARALQVMIDDIDAEHDRSTTLNNLKCAVREPAGVSKAMRNVASFIRRNHVVVHTLVDIPQQA